MTAINRIVLSLLVLWAWHAQASCPSDLQAAALAARYANLQPAPNLPADMTMVDALCGRDKYVHFLPQVAGKVVGYKLSLTNPAIQKRFNHPEPIRGTLFESMLLRGDAEVPAKFGAWPMYEADMVVEVADEGINQAKTPLEALRHLSRIYPFIELPDLMTDNPAKVSGLSLTLTNMAARLGVLGEPLAVTATPELVAALEHMTVRFTDLDGKVLENNPGSVLLGNPLNSVLWLVKDLNAAGIRLKSGDLLSLGSFSQPYPAKPGIGARLTYDGLPGNPTVSVRFK